MPSTPSRVRPYRSGRDTREDNARVRVRVFHTARQSAPRVLKTRRERAAYWQTASRIDPSPTGFRGFRGVLKRAIRSNVTRVKVLCAPADTGPRGCRRSDRRDAARKTFYRLR